MSEIVLDLVEDILKRLDVQDLVRCKSVCKSWLSFLSSSRFVQTHLEYTCKKDHKNHELGHRRIIMPTYANTINDGKVLSDAEYYMDVWCIVGSINGLVCFSTSYKNPQVLVTNPLTREVKKLQTAPKIPKIFDRTFLCWGFGYDSFTDDYKVVMGIKMGKAGTLFRVLTLKSNIWKVTRQVKYKICQALGILWNGALHWFMEDCNSKKKIILSFDLSSEEFKEIPQPDDSRYVCDYSNSLGIAEGGLCIYRDHIPYQRWIMKHYNDTKSWEPLPYGCETNTYDVAHMLQCDIPNKYWCLLNEDDKFSSKIGKYICCPVYVQSLVSPHLNEKPKTERNTKNKKRSDKVVSS